MSAYKYLRRAERIAWGSIVAWLYTAGLGRQFPAIKFEQQQLIIDAADQKHFAKFQFLKSRKATHYGSYEGSFDQETDLGEAEIRIKLHWKGAALQAVEIDAVSGCQAACQDWARTVKAQLPNILVDYQWRPN